jgi:hypothetical protein
MITTRFYKHDPEHKSRSTPFQASSAHFSARQAILAAPNMGREGLLVARAALRRSKRARETRVGVVDLTLRPGHVGLVSVRRAAQDYVPIWLSATDRAHVAAGVVQSATRVELVA